MICNINKIRELLSEEASFVLATLLDTKGSAPQVPGSTAILSKDRVLSGTLGGGILEGSAQEKAAQALEKKTSLLLDVDLDADIDAKEGAICGGNARVLLDADPAKFHAVFENMSNTLDQGMPGLLVTSLHFSGDLVIDRYWIPVSSFGKRPLPEHIQAHMGALTHCLRKNKYAYLQGDDSWSLCIQTVSPLPKLVIAGAGHIGKAVSHLAKLLDFEVTLIDDRPEFANKNNIPDADKIIVDNIGRAVASVPVTKDTYFLIVTRGHAADTEALRSCIHSDSAYIGMIGSKRKVTLMRENFLRNKWADNAQFDRVHAPVGLDINSKTIQEIALSICAEIVQVRNSNSNTRGAEIHGIILAAGTSSRMGKPKMLLPFGGTTVIGTLILQTVLSELENVTVVLGANADQLSRETDRYEVRTVLNTAYENGMLSSVQCGIKALPDTTSAVMIMLGDQPMITREVINTVIQAYRQSEKKLIVATYKGKRGHPLLIGSRYFREILKLSGENSLKDILLKYPEEIEEVEVDDPAILRDIDTEDDYIKEIENQKNI